MSKLTNSGIDSIGLVPLGTHCCNIYDTKEQLMDTLVSYYMEGLKNNELCIWISGDFIDKPYFEKIFYDRIPGFEAYVRDGLMEIRSYQDWYLEHGVFSQEHVMNKWADKCREADIKKYNGLRVSADGSWTGPYWEQLTHYESEVTKVISQYPMLALCNYHISSQTSDQLVDTILAHQAVVLHKDSKAAVVASGSHARIVRKLEEKISALEELNKNYSSRSRA